MRLDIVVAAVDWLNSLGENEPLEIIFHGGEPLAVGAGFFRQALPLLKNGLSRQQVRFSIQSNLWLLDEELCELFREHRVSIGTSLDGPGPINDAQRGSGHFWRTMSGIDLARVHGLEVGCICTFTAQSAPKFEQIFDFFVREQLNFTVHAAVPPLRSRADDRWPISPRDYGELLVGLLEHYLKNLHKIRIPTLDVLCRSVSSQQGGICTFNDCLGKYLCLGPQGEIYPCQRFGGLPEFSMGNVLDADARSDLSSSRVWREFAAWENQVDSECGDCPYLRICRGGCPYNRLAASPGRFSPSPRDPYCLAYRRIFDEIVERSAEEFFVEDNLRSLVERKKPSFRSRGRLLSIMNDDPHPHEVTRHARRAVAAAILAETGSPKESSGKFEVLGLTDHVERTEIKLAEFHDRLKKPGDVLGNLYLHVTFACPLSCSHCYARAGPERIEHLPVPETLKACREGARLGFRHVVITGGEPLAHPQRDTLLDGLAESRHGLKPSLVVMRTALAMRMDRHLVRRVGRSADQVVVSIDGDRETHDRRRGRGSYDLVVSNLRALVGVSGAAELSIAAVLPQRLIDGPPGESVRGLAAELGIRRVRFRPVLPIGRAETLEPETSPESLWGHIRPDEILAHGFNPMMTCGIGHNLYVEPDGSAFPCYAWHGPRWKIGVSGLSSGLSELTDSEAFRGLRRHNVNSNRRCRSCTLRYLCGGACRAWNRQSMLEQVDLDAPPADCSALHRRARSILSCAMDHLRITAREWMAAGLSLPERPPEVEEMGIDAAHEGRMPCLSS
jgi:uncharacterized protein